MKIFVYGTLRKGLHNHDWLRGSACEGLATLRGTLFVVHQAGQYSIPGFKLEGATPVVGEVYEIEDRTRRTLDMLEGHPDVYRRTPAVTEDGNAVEVYVYQDRFKTSNIVVDGDWCKWVEERKKG